MTKIDSTIITRCQAGDKDAFRLLVETCQRMVFSVALKMLADEEEAQDIVQETFLRVWLNISKYDARRSFTTWLYAIASRLCLDHLKSRTHVVAMPEDESVLRRYASADGQLELENREWVAIVRLSEEVEEATGLTAKQVKSNLYVARQTIREHLKNMGYE